MLPFSLFILNTSLSNTIVLDYRACNQNKLFSKCLTMVVNKSNPARRDPPKGMTSYNIVFKASVYRKEQKGKEDNVDYPFSLLIC